MTKADIIYYILQVTSIIVISLGAYTMGYLKANTDIKDCMTSLTTETTNYDNLINKVREYNYDKSRYTKY